MSRPAEEGFERLAPPRKGEWRSLFPEKEQTFDDYVASCAHRGSSLLSHFSIQPFGSVSSRAAATIQLMRDYAGAFFGLETVVHDPLPMFENAHVPIRDQYNSSILLDVQLGTTRKVYANFTEVEQVVLNFVINAQQSIETAGRMKGRILIRVFDAGKKVRLEVQDDGPGVLPDDEPKLFQPFFTTKPVGKGTGLGLSVSYGIIESYGGRIGYRNNEWGGATFFFELPSVDPARVPPAPASSSTPSDDRSPVLQRSVSPRI